VARPRAGEPDNLKAVYRRGQARMGLAAWLDAEADLKRALQLAKSGDPSQVDGRGVAPSLPCSAWWRPQPAQRWAWVAHGPGPR
jgi:hypothetical protein